MELKELKDIYNIIKRQIENFDFKSEIFLTVSGLFLGFFIAGNVFSALFVSFWPTFFFLLFFLLIITGIIIFICVIFPKSKKKERNNNGKESKIYYKDISKTDIFVEVTNEELKEEYKKQIVINSKICTRKHNLLKWGISFFIASLVAFFIGIILAVV
ncbi:Pycsar system effector family protein [Spiroplasma endosymbiont of Othius punctulatus]|uniref:Pycsar system effector family protein n=1 Tax=Spiroplasma endosymbiont of Othius punctulatus TaxID=3066289 RepID=UPI0030CF8FDF